jgi:ADP-heptose:LPS heptosyltransferase
MIVPATESVRNILIVLQNNHIGDTICSLPFFAALKRRYPAAECTLVAAVKPYPIPLRDLNPLVDHVLYYDKSSLKTILHFYKTLRQKKYQIGIVPSAIARSRTSHIINFLSGARIRAGVGSIDGVPNPMRYLLNIKADFHWNKDRQVHQTERHLEVVRLLGCDTPAEIYDADILHLTQEELAAARTFLDDAFPDRAARIVALHPGSGKKRTVWPTENFLEIMARLHRELGAKFVIDYGMVDEPIITVMKAELDRKSIPYTLVMNPYKLVAAIIKLADLYITNDTGPAHIAWSVRAHMISLHGPTKAYEWGHSGEHASAIQSPTDRMSDITVDQVYAACVAMMEKRKTGTNGSLTGKVRSRE